MSQEPELFTVMPAEQLKRLLRQSLPAETRIAWEKLGALAVTAGKIGVVDAGSIHPRHPREIKALEWQFASADVWLQRAQLLESKVDRIFAVILLAPALDREKVCAQWEIVEGTSMAIDSASAAFGDYQRIMSEMRGGGPLSLTCLGRGSRSEAHQTQMRQAANYLREHGFPAEIETYKTGAISVRFSPGLSDEQVAEANELLAGISYPDQVWIAGSHTSGMLERELMSSAITQLTDDHGPYLFACRTGFGDGIYNWDKLMFQGQLGGYLCNFLPQDESTAKL